MYLTLKFLLLGTWPSKVLTNRTCSWLHQPDYSQMEYSFPHLVKGLGRKGLHTQRTLFSLGIGICQQLLQKAEWGSRSDTLQCILGWCWLKGRALSNQEEAAGSMEDCLELSKCSGFTCTRVSRPIFSFFFFTFPSFLRCVPGISKTIDNWNHGYWGTPVFYRNQYNTCTVVFCTIL